MIIDAISNLQWQGQRFAAISTITVSNQKLRGAISMLKQIGDALTEYSEKGYTVIVSDHNDGRDCQEIASYVLDILNGLKCSYDKYYHTTDDMMFIVDTMNDVRIIKDTLDDIMSYRHSIRHSMIDEPLFMYLGLKIYDPYMSMDGSEEVEPIEYYGINNILGVVVPWLKK